MTVVVEKRPNGTFRVRVKAKRGGKWVPVKEVGGFTSKAEANREAEKARKLVRQGKLGTLEATATVGEVLDDHHARLAARGAPGAFHALSAKQNLASIVDAEIGQLDSDKVQDAIDAITSPHAAKKALTMLRAAINKTPQKNANPCNGVKAAKAPKRVVRIFTVDEARAVWKHVAPSHRDVFALSLITTLRPGELAAAQMDQIDIGVKRLRVTRTMTRELPKDGDERWVPLTAEALGIVKRLMKAAGERGDTFLFDDIVRRTARDTDWANRLKRAIRSAVDAGDAPTLCRGWRLICRWCKHVEERLQRPRGDVKCPRCDRLLWQSPLVERVRWYDIRHTGVTMMIDAGVHVNVVSALAGHSSPAFTMDNYVHQSPAKMAAAVENVRLGKRGSR